MKKFEFIKIIFFIFLVTGCNFFPKTNEGKNKETKEPEYAQDIIWQLELKSCYDSEYALQSGKYYYIAERRKGYEEDYFYSKIDLSTGDKIWETKSFNGPPCSFNPPLKEIINGTTCLIISGEDKYIHIIDDMSGQLLASVKFFKNNKDESFNTLSFGGPSLSFNNNNLYWASGTKIIKLNLTGVELFEENENEYYIEPEIVWTNQINNKNILIWPVMYNSILYFVSYDSYPETGYCVLGAFNTITETIKWVKKSNILTGLGFNNMLVADNKLYVIEDAQGCYDLETGETFWEQNETEEELYNKISIGAGCYCMGITYDNGKLFFTNGAASTSSAVTGIPEEYLKNIQCIDAKTGKYIWGDFPKNSASLFTKPIVVNNQCFVRTWDELRVYNAETGQLIGKDSSITSIGSEIPISFENTFIYIKKNYETGSAVLIAINVNNFN